MKVKTLLLGQVCIAGSAREAGGLSLTITPAHCQCARIEAYRAWHENCSWACKFHDRFLPS